MYASNSKQVYCILNNWCRCINLSCGPEVSLALGADLAASLPTYYHSIYIMQIYRILCYISYYKLHLYITDSILAILL